MGGTKGGDDGKRGRREAAGGGGDGDGDGGGGDGADHGVNGVGIGVGGVGVGVAPPALESHPHLRPWGGGIDERAGRRAARACGASPTCGWGCCCAREGVCGTGCAHLGLDLGHLAHPENLMM